MVIIDKKNSIHILCNMWYEILSTVSAILHSTIIVHKMAIIFLLGFDNKLYIHNKEGMMCNKTHMWWGNRMFAEYSSVFIKFAKLQSAYH